MNHTFSLTPSERMALCFIIQSFMEEDATVELIVDCSQEPAVETNVGDLLAKFMLTEGCEDHKK